MSITSEKQKRYDPTNGGFSYYTLFHADKGERPEFADVGDIVEEFGEGGKAYVCSRDAKGRIKWTEKADWDRQTGDGSGSGGGSSLPSMTGKNGKVLGVTLDSEDKEQIEWVTPTGGGAEKFVVTLTYDAQTETWTADDTLADIVAAKADGDTVVCAYTDSNLGVTFELPCVAAENLGSEEEPYYVCAFGGTVMTETGSSSVVVAGNTGEIDDWSLNSTPNGGELPSYSSPNNGQVLGVSSGNLAWVDSNAPLIVTMTEDQQTQEDVGDKTNLEVYNAYSAGRNVVIHMSDGGVDVRGSIVNAIHQPGQTNEYAFGLQMGDSQTIFGGGENDFFKLVE